MDIAVAFPPNFHEQLSAVVGYPIPQHEEWLQIPMCESIFSPSVHWEYSSNGTIALHVEPEQPSPEAKGLADFLVSKGKGKICGGRWRYYEYEWTKIPPKGNNAQEVGAEILRFQAELLSLIGEYFRGIKEVVEEFSAAHKRAKAKAPYNCNIIDELHASENAHTRILIRLLQYNVGETYPILESFLQMLPGWKDAAVPVGKPQINSNVNYIDGLIISPGRYAVIIENKIHWAADQEAQLTRYYNYIKSEGVPEEYIWVVYLTSDGNKIVTEYSLHEETRKELGSRYVPWNYRDDILPWLKQDILPSCAMKETALISALGQYIDYLEGFFGIRESGKKMQTELELKLKELIGVKPSLTRSELYNKVCEMDEKAAAFHQMTSNYRNELERQLLEPFIDMTKDYFTTLPNGINLTCSSWKEQRYIQIYEEKWKEHGIHLEWFPLYVSTFFEPAKDMPLVLHVEGKTETAEAVREKLREKGYPSPDNDREWHPIHVPNVETSFADMTDNARREFLRQTYDAAQEVIEYLDAIFATLNNGSEEKAE